MIHSVLSFPRFMLAPAIIQSPFAAIVLSEQTGSSVICVK
jgi:hypothetical protein